MTAQVESERQRLHAESGAAAERVKKTVETEVHLASIRQFLSVLKENNIAIDSTMAQKIFDSMNQPKAGQWRKNKEGAGDSDEWPSEKSGNGANNK